MLETNTRCPDGLADRLAGYVTQLAEAQGDGFVDDADIEPPFTRLMDTLAFDSAPPARRLIELLRTRGWTGWTKLERVSDVDLMGQGRANAEPPPCHHFR
jgi:hypothetical protein